MLPVSPCSIPSGKPRLTRKSWSSRSRAIRSRSRSRSRGCGRGVAVPFRRSSNSRGPLRTRPTTATRCAVLTGSSAGERCDCRAAAVRDARLRHVRPLARWLSDRNTSRALSDRQQRDAGRLGPDPARGSLGRFHLFDDRALSKNATGRRAAMGIAPLGSRSGSAFWSAAARFSVFRSRLRRFSQSLSGSTSWRCSWGFRSRPHRFCLSSSSSERSSGSSFGMAIFFR